MTRPPLAKALPDVLAVFGGIEEVEPFSNGASAGPSMPDPSAVRDGAQHNDLLGGKRGRISREILSLYRMDNQNWRNARPGGN